MVLFCCRGRARSDPLRRITPSVRCWPYPSHLRLLALTPGCSSWRLQPARGPARLASRTVAARLAAAPEIRPLGSVRCQERGGVASAVCISGWSAPSANQSPNLPKRGRCELVYLCARLYVTDGRSDRQFSIVIRIGGAHITEYLRLTLEPLQRSTCAQMLQICVSDSVTNPVADPGGREPVGVAEVVVEVIEAGVPVLEIAGRLSADALGVCRRVSAAAVILLIDLDIGAVLRAGGHIGHWFRSRSWPSW